MRTTDESLTGKKNDSYVPALSGHDSRTDHKIEHAHEILRDTVAPMIQTMSANAARIDRREFYYYVRKHTGRRCSCFKIEASPDAHCHVCYGTGIVAGFEKYGTITEVVDATFPNLRLVNMYPTYKEDTRPVFFGIIDPSKPGYILADVPIRANTGKLDTYNLIQPMFSGVTNLYVVDGGVDNLISDGSDLEPFLGKSSIGFKIEFLPSHKKVLFSHLLLRYSISESPIIWGDITKSEESLLSMNPLGLIDAYQELSIFFDAKRVNKYHNEDLLIRIIDNRRFKIIQVTENRVANINTSNDVRARYLIPGTDIGGFNLIP
jgi:hypothetical protein